MLGAWQQTIATHPQATHLQATASRIFSRLRLLVWWVGQELSIFMHTHEVSVAWARPEAAGIHAHVSSLATNERQSLGPGPRRLIFMHTYEVLLPMFFSFLGPPRSTVIS